jgi:tRNA-Thr(GGU) m(6)t(6)A37 methyltransferase TsaA
MTTMATLQEIMNREIVIKPIGFIRSPITDLDKAPRLGSEDSIMGDLVVGAEYQDAFLGLEPGQKIVILYWMHLAERDMFQVHPRKDYSRPKRGVFSTRSPQRPNPIAIDTVEIIEIKGTVLKVRGLDAMDGTLLLDIKCVV